ncbi:MAG TPA: hypothetical protein VFX30_11035 [bacterium]|nr:hypothetical protein [bacterium]
MKTPKRIALALGAVVAIAVIAADDDAVGEQFQIQPEPQIVLKDTGISAALVTETVKSISVPSEGSYTCKGGNAAVEIGEAGRILLGSSTGTSFLVTTSSGRKVIVFAPSEGAWKAAMSMAIESQLAGLAVTFRNNSSETQDAFFKGACDGADKVSIANEITVTK